MSCLPDATDWHTVQVVVSGMIQSEPLLTESRRPVLLQLVQRLQQKLAENRHTPDFSLKKEIPKAHILPLTNCAFNKTGDRFVTGSYDRTCKVWETATGDELLTLEGHGNVVYAVAFNNPFGDRVLTGSFDRTAKLWSATTGVPSRRLCDGLTRDRPFCCGIESADKWFLVHKTRLDGAVQASSSTLLWGTPWSWSAWPSTPCLLQ